MVKFDYYQNKSHNIYKSNRIVNSNISKITNSKIKKDISTKGIEITDDSSNSSMDSLYWSDPSYEIDNNNIININSTNNYSNSIRKSSRSKQTKSYSDRNISHTSSYIDRNNKKITRKRDNHINHDNIAIKSSNNLNDIRKSNRLQIKKTANKTITIKTRNNNNKLIVKTNKKPINKFIETNKKSINKIIVKSNKKTINKLTTKNLIKLDKQINNKIKNKVIDKTKNKIKVKAIDKSIHESTTNSLIKSNKQINNNKKQYWRKSKWEGNSDDGGSVDSGLLDENICFECGENTLDENDWNQLILCDLCDGEYHLKCLHLDLPPRKAFHCPKCLQESKEFQFLKYNVIGEQFKISNKRKKLLSICYSPSKPLDKAWDECKDKGFMVVSQVFSYDIMKKLTHGSIVKHTHSGRTADSWSGIITEMSVRIKNSCRNVIIRGGRFDLKLPEFVVETLQLDQLLEPITSRLRTIMGNPEPIVRTHNLVFAPVGSPEQNWHYDDCMTKAKLHRYFTILIPLNTIDSSSGGTEIWSKRQKRADLVRPRPGDAFVFNGSLCHRGQANNGSTHRFFYYASYACKADANTTEYG